MSARSRKGPLQEVILLDASGNVVVFGSGGTSAADGDAFTAGSSVGTPLMGERDDAATVVANGKLGIPRINSKRSLFVTLYDSAGAEVTSLGGGTQYDLDSASAGAEKITMAGGVRKDAVASLVDTNGDRTASIYDASGRLWVNPSGVTQPISAASLPLPTGAATETTLAKLAAQLFDGDTGAGTATTAGFFILLPGSGGPVVGGSSGSPIGVQVSNLPTTVTMGAGAVGPGVQLTTQASDSPLVAVAGITTGAAVITDANATIQQYLRGVVKLAITPGGWLVTVSAVAIAAVVTSVDDSASSQQLLASLATRKGYKLFNDTTVVAYVKEGTTATTADYSYQIQPGGYYESVGVGCYTGRIDCIWASNASGAIKITELS